MSQLNFIFQLGLAWPPPPVFETYGEEAGGVKQEGDDGARGGEQQRIHKFPIPLTPKDDIYHLLLLFWFNLV